MADWKIRKVVIPAAGLGTRFLPATKAIPKELLPIVDVPTLQLVVEEAVAAGFTDVVLVNGRGKSAIEDHFDIAFEMETTLRARGKTAQADGLRAIANLAHVHSVRQKEPLGLGHAVLCAEAAVGDEPFAVMLGDDLIDSVDPGIGQLVRVAQETGKGAVALLAVPERETSLYGIATGKSAGARRTAIEHLVEKPKPGTVKSNLAIIGRYVLPPDVFAILRKVKPGAGGEVQLTDALAQLAVEGRLIGVELEGTRHDAGDRLGYLKANLAYAMKRPELRDGLIAYMRELVR